MLALPPHRIQLKVQLIAMIAFNGFGLWLLVFSLYQLFYGERSLNEYKELTQELLSTKKQLKLITEQREKLEYKVNLLQDNSLDLDLLEERVTYMLNFSNPNTDIMVIDPQYRISE